MKIKIVTLGTIVVIGTAVSRVSLGVEPTAADVLAAFDRLMTPEEARMTATMTVTRADGSSRSYELRILKKGDTKSRVSFDAPPAMRGQEILQNGDNMWIYLPDIKRAMPISNRDSFQGGDFSNSDVVRGKLALDFSPAFAASCSIEVFCLDLTATTQKAPYKSIKLRINRGDGLPLTAEYYGASGHLLRKVVFSEPKDFGANIKRPARLLMTNETAKTNQRTELRIAKIDIESSISEGRFVLSDLGK